MPCYFAGCFPDGSAVKNPPADTGAAGDVGLIPWLGRSLGKGDGTPLQCLEKSHGQRSQTGSMGSQESDAAEPLSTLLVTFTTLLLFLLPRVCLSSGKKNTPDLLWEYHPPSNLSPYDLLPLIAQAVGTNWPSDTSRIGNRSWSLL